MRLLSGPLSLPIFLLYYGWLLVKQPAHRLAWSLPRAGLVALLLCLASAAADNLAAPIGILLTPVVLVTVTALVNTPRRQPAAPISGAVVTAALVCLHDAGLKLYGGGAHDLEGLGFIHLFLALGLLPSYSLLLRFLISAPGVSREQRLGAALTLPLVVGLYLYFFGSLGLGRFYESHILE